MGNTKTIRRKNYRLAPEGPQFPQLEDPMIACPSCGTDFVASAIAGTRLDRRCPNCGAPLDAVSYDARHDELEASLPTLRQNVETAQRPHQRWLLWSQRAEHLPKVLARPLTALVGIPLQRSQRKLDVAADALVQAKSQLRHLARSRYYASEWFQSTHTPLYQAGDKYLPPYKLSAAYDSVKGGGRRFRLAPVERPDVCKGIIGEWRFFEDIAMAARNPASPLFGARLVPNAYVPKELFGLRDSGADWVQVDCVVVTTRGAFSVEVKNRRVAVVVGKGYSYVGRVKRSTGADGQVRERIDRHFGDDALDQAFFHHDAVAAMLRGTLPESRVLDMLVYVDPESFRSPEQGFVDRLAVCRLEDAVALMEQALVNLPPLMTPGELGALGQHLLATYGDLNRHKTYLHARMLARQRDCRGAMTA